MSERGGALAGLPPAATRRFSACGRGGCLLAASGESVWWG